MRAIILASVTTLTLAACSGGQMTPIRDFGVASITATESSLKTQKELVLPATFQSLPRPTPGGTNRADF